VISPSQLPQIRQAVTEMAQDPFKICHAADSESRIYLIANYCPGHALLPVPLNSTHAEFKIPDDRKHSPACHPDEEPRAFRGDEGRISSFWDAPCLNILFKPNSPNKEILRQCNATAPLHRL